MILSVRCCVMIASFDVRNVPDVARLTGCTLGRPWVRLLITELKVWTTGATIRVLMQGAAHQAVCGCIFRPDGARQGSFQ